MANTADSRHFDALDGLRGVAAVVVVLRHSLGAVNIPTAVLEQILTSPLIVLLNASGAVQLFFVLSGFVLAASLSRQRGSRVLPQYFVRRVFRIHPPYVFGVLFAWGASFFYVQATRADGVGGMIERLSRVHLGAAELGASLLFPGNAHFQLSAGWSLEVEMIFSLLMPLMLLTARWARGTALVAFCIIPLALGDHGHPVFKFAIDFALGIVVFLERDRLAAWLGPLRGLRAGLFFGAALLLFVLPWLLGWKPLAQGDPRSIVVMGIGAAGLTAFAAFVPLGTTLFANTPARFLGRTSYSLYLVHYPLVLLLSPRIVSAHLGLSTPVAIAVAVLAIGLPLSALSYRWIEVPGIRAGNRVCAWVATKMGVDTVRSRLVAKGADPAGS